MAYERLRCPSCEADFGQEVRFLDHLTDVHGITDHLALYLGIHHGGSHPTCGCGFACPEKLPWAGWKKGFTSQYARGHNARVSTAFSDPEVTKKSVAKRLEGYQSGRNIAWNSGLTKETDGRLAKQAENVSRSLLLGHSSGSITDWRLKDPGKARVAAEKQSHTMIARYGTGGLAPWNRGETKETNEIIANSAKKISTRYELPDPGRRVKRNELQERISVHASKFTLLSDLSEYVTRRVVKLRFKCVTCGTEQQKSLAMLEESTICYHCHPKESKGQLELYDFVRSLVPDAVLSDRSELGGMELDVYVPSRRFGVEYDGLYWHSELFVDRLHATRKADLAVNNGITLFRVFADEWRDKRSLVEDMIRHRLGMVTGRLGARQCEIVQLSRKRRQGFIGISHLDGDTRSRIAFGLVHDGEVVAAMSLRRPQHNAHDGWLEVARFCSDPKVHVQGALARLASACLAYAKGTGHHGLMTYVDRRLGNAKGYEAVGFKRVRETGPRFWWTDFHDRFDRFSVRADKKNGVTQAQRAEDEGVTMIWGCPNIVLELT